MTIGIEEFRDPGELSFNRMLLQPFRGESGAYPIGQRHNAVASRWIECDELKLRLDREEPIAVIDVREPEEFAGPLGHIAGSRNMPLPVFATRLGELARLEHTPLVLVCRTDKRSAKAAQILHDAGWRRVAVLRRGMEQWNENGLPVASRRAAQ
jgi:rhodanese-related sulfurtransferase